MELLSSSLSKFYYIFFGNKAPTIAYLIQEAYMKNLDVRPLKYLASSPKNNN